MIRNSRLVIGRFADTLPTFDFAALDYVGLVNFDAGLYSVPPQQPSTKWGRICGPVTVSSNGQFGLPR